VAHRIFPSKFHLDGKSGYRTNTGLVRP
jgi:hypothetical protein